MKKKLLASLLTIAMCLALIAGSTYALFTSEDAVNIAVSSGKVKVTATVDELVTYSMGEATAENGVFDNLGTAVLDQSSATDTLTLTNITPGDKVTFRIDLVNESNVTIQYRLVWVVDGALSNELVAKAGATLESATAIVNNKTEWTKWDIPTDETKTQTVWVSIELPTECTLQGESASISFKIEAVQGNAEVIDEWDGNIPSSMPETLVVDGETQTIHVKDVDAFVYLSTLSDKWAEFYTDGNGRDYSNYANGAGANYYYSGLWTVSLEADIDLDNLPIEPVKLVFGEATGASAFKGNNHVISNINTTTGLFANSNRITYADLVLENVKATNGALTGTSNTNISNVTVKNATISGTDYVGGLVGYIYGNVTDCEVVDSTVVGVKEVGGLIGYIASSSGNNEVTNNEVRNVSVSANNRAAGLVAQANVGVKVYNNTVDTVTVGAEDVSKYQPDAIVSNALEPANVYDNTVVDCIVGREAYGLILIPNGENSKVIVNDEEGFLNLTKLFEDWTALFTDGNGTAYSNYANAAGADYYYSGRWTVSLEADIDLNNATIAPITIKHPVSAGTPTFDGNNYTISNAKIVTDATTENEAGLFNANSIAFKNLKLDNIHVTGSNVGNSTAGVLSGSCNAPVSNITITNSSVTGGKYTGGIVGYGYTSVSNCTLTNVTVKGGYKLGGIIGYICASGENAGDVIGNTLIDCTVDGIGGGVFAGGKDKYIVGKLVGNYNCNGTCNNNIIENMTTSANANIGEIEAGLTVTQ